MLIFAFSTLSTHSLANDIHCAGLNAKLLQITLPHSLYCWVAYNPFLTLICCLNTVLSNDIELGPRFLQEMITFIYCKSWMLAFKRLLKTDLNVFLYVAGIYTLASEE